jgi:hypothetical protein
MLAMQIYLSAALVEIRMIGQKLLRTSVRSERKALTRFKKMRKN